MSATTSRKARPSLPGKGAREKTAEKNIAAMIRVDHAGEFGALRIYKGQLAVLSRVPRAKENAASIATMAAQEQNHFDAFSELRSWCRNGVDGREGGYGMHRRS